jgi:hypothetical protein
VSHDEIEVWRDGQEHAVGIALSLIISAVGLILALAVHPSGSHAVDPNTVGWILFVLGLVGLILDLLLWSEWGPGYMRRTAVVDRGPAYVDRGAAYPARRARGTRRTVVEEEEAVPPAGPPGPPPAY